MRKAICLFFVILTFCVLSTEAFAKNEGLVNEAENSVIASVGEVLSRVNGESFSVADRKIFENYFKTRDLSAEDAEKVNAHLEKGVKYFDKLDAEKITDLSKKEKIYFCNYLDDAAEVLGLTITINADGKAEIRDEDTSELVYKQEQIIKATGDSYLNIVLAVSILIGLLAVIIRYRKVSKKND